MWMIGTAIGLGIALALVALYLGSCIRVLNEYERAVIFRLGHAIPKPKGPGLILVFVPIDRMVRGLADHHKSDRAPGHHYQR